MDTGLNFSRVLKYEGFIAFWLLLVDGLAVVLWLNKFGLNPYRGIQGAGDMVGFVALLLFIPLSALEAIMIFYEMFKKRERQEGRREGLQEGRQEGLQEGRQEGLQEGLQEGRQEGLQEGLQEGRQKGLQEGRQKGLQEGRQEARQELLQELTRVFAGDKDAMEKIDKFFNGTPATGQK